MYQFNLSRPLNYPLYPQRGVTSRVLMPGQRYVTEGSFLKELLPLDEGISMEPWNSDSPSLKGGWKEKARILFIRNFGVGDLLFLTPLAREIKKRTPQAHVALACEPDFISVLEDQIFDALVPCPLLSEDLAGYDHILAFGGLIENDPRAKQQHVVDLFADHAGIELSDKRTCYRLMETEVVAAYEEYPRSKRLRVALHLQASTPVRSYPIHRINQLIKMGIELDWEWLLMGYPGSFPDLVHSQIINLTRRSPPTTMRETLAWMATCDGVVGPDSGFVHFAGSMQIPTVALYGPFVGCLSMAYQPSIHLIEPKAPCAPCFHHTKPHTGIMPAHCPGGAAQICRVLESIEPEQIIKALKEQLTHASSYTL